MEGDSDKGQVGIHNVYSRIQFPSKGSLAKDTFLTKVLILLLPEYLQMVVVRYGRISAPM
jgi:hypothetical protein